MTCKLRWMVRLTRVTVSYVSYPSIWSCGEGAPFASHIPNQPANSVRHASVLVLCSCRRHDCYIAISLQWRPGQATSAESVERITKSLFILVYVSKSEVTRRESRNTNSRRSFGDGINPRKHRHAGRPLRLTLRTLPFTQYVIHANRRKSGMRHPGGDQRSVDLLPSTYESTRKRGLLSLANVRPLLGKYTSRESCSAATRSHTLCPAACWKQELPGLTQINDRLGG
jgi:hypothetical protein